MKLKQGDRAKDFQVQDIHGNEIKLSDYKGKKIILSFMRNVSCPFCNVRVHKLMGNSVALEQAGVQMILVFESTAKKLLGSVLHQGILPWPAINDTERKLYTAYGTERSFIKMVKGMISGNVRETMAIKKTLDAPTGVDNDASHTQVPAVFFINEDFVIDRAYYGKHINDHIDMNELKKFAGIRIF